MIELGARTITKGEILAFAREFDPQPFHTDEAAARHTIFGGLIASGWHTGSLSMRLFYEGLIKDVVSLGSPGFDELRWVRPVRPGDTLSARLTVLECAPSRSKPRSRGDPRPPRDAQPGRRGGAEHQGHQSVRAAPVRRHGRGTAPA